MRLFFYVWLELCVYCFIMCHLFFCVYGFFVVPVRIDFVLGVLYRVFFWIRESIFLVNYSMLFFRNQYQCWPWRDGTALRWMSYFCASQGSILLGGKFFVLSFLFWYWLYIKCSLINYLFRFVFYVLLIFLFNIE